MFLNQDNELVGLRADVVRTVADCVPAVGKHSLTNNCGDAVVDIVTVSTNRPHGAYHGAKIYRNLDLEWQKQVEASTGNRKIDIDLTLSETETGYELLASVCRDTARHVYTRFDVEKITANNPEKATENIRKKALQWGDTVFNPVNLELRFAEPRLIPASVIGEMKRQLVEKLTDALIENHRSNRECRDVSRNDSKNLDCSGDVSGNVSTTIPTIDPDEIPDHLMTCHHCIRYANGLCSKETGQRAEPLFIRNGSHIFRLEFDCKNCLMYIQK